MAMNNRRKQYAALSLALIFLIVLPFVVGDYTITTLIRIMYFGFLALSVGLLAGQAGMTSFTQTAFFGMAGYVIGLLGQERGVPFGWTVFWSLAIVLFSSFVIGLVIMRTHKVVFLMISLAIGQIFWAFARQNTNLLHGWAGIRGIKMPPLLGINFLNERNFYWLSLVIFAGMVFLLWKLVHSQYGLVLNGIRESPRRMSALGYPVYWLRVVSFVIAGLYAGIGGILATYYNGNITPTTIQLSRTIWVLLLVVLGGANYFWGPILGTFLGVWLEVLVSQATPRYNTIIGIVFVGTVLLAPNGVLGLLDQGVRKFKSRHPGGWKSKPEDCTQKL